MAETSAVRPPEGPAEEVAVSAEYKPLKEKSKRETLRTLEEVRAEMEKADEGSIFQQGKNYWLMTSKKVGEIDNVTRWRMPRAVFLQAQRTMKKAAQ